jgi:hypothetical protein
MDRPFVSSAYLDRVSTRQMDKLSGYHKAYFRLGSINIFGSPMITFSGMGIRINNKFKFVCILVDVLSWVLVWLWWPEDAMWVPSCSVMSGRTQVKDAKATITDSPPKGYGTPNLVDVTGRWLGSGLYISARVSGLRSQVLVNVRVCLTCLGATHRGRPAEGPGRSRGNGNPSLYYKSRPEGTWGSPHDSIYIRWVSHPKR